MAKIAADLSCSFGVCLARSSTPHRVAVSVWPKCQAGCVDATTFETTSRLISSALRSLKDRLSKQFYLSPLTRCSLRKSTIIINVSRVSQQDLVKDRRHSKLFQEHETGCTTKIDHALNDTVLPQFYHIDRRPFM